VILAKGQLLGVHVKDALPQIIRGAPIGKGIVPFQETFQALTQMGFWGRSASKCGDKCMLTKIPSIVLFPYANLSVVW
jgi:hypothetical protein